MLTYFTIKKKEIHLNIREIDKTLHKIRQGTDDDLSYDIRVVHNKQDKTIGLLHIHHILDVNIK